jgi:hypothetical protein
VKPITLLRRRFRKAMGFAALYPSYKLLRDHTTPRSRIDRPGAMVSAGAMTAL